jgi:hypothetical protein
MEMIIRPTTINRWANQFQHDVDVVIEVPEKGKAVQFGRFNQGGYTEILRINTHMLKLMILKSTS